MNTLGSTPKTIFLNHSADELHLKFEAEGKKVTLTMSAALVTGNVINGSVNGSAIPAITFATSNDATMAALAAAIAAMPGVESATVTSVAGAATNDREIVVVADDHTNIVALSGFAVTAGASQATVTIATVNSYIYPGMPVELSATGKVQPLTPGTSVSANCIGHAINAGGSGEMITVAMRGDMVIIGESSGAIVPGAVNYNSYNATTGRNIYDQTSVTEPKMAGWNLDIATAAGDEIRVVTIS